MGSGAEWFCAGTKAPAGKAELLVGRYYPDFKRDPEHFQIKFLGGTQKVTKGVCESTPEETLYREMLEEVLAPGGRVMSCEQIDAATVSLPGHKKCFYLITLEGPLRESDLYEIEYDVRLKRDRTEKLSPPFYMDVRELWHAIFPGHREALRQIIYYLAARRPEWAWAAADLAEELAA
ncbi:MAG: hypothetical protein AMXMBFR44_3400 [Candidatus Campbellbacteria bacterium]